MNAVFPDDVNDNNLNGGFNTRTGFKKSTLDKMLNECDEREAGIISRSTNTVLYDYQGAILLKAFPLHFPYGVEYDRKDGETRSGVRYLNFLSMLSSDKYHTAQFSSVLHNMFERQRMVVSAYLRNPTNVSEGYTSIMDDDILDAVERFENGCSGSGIGGLFLKKIEAVTASMAHTEGAAKKARHQAYQWYLVHHQASASTRNGNVQHRPFARER